MNERDDVIERELLNRFRRELNVAVQPFDARAITRRAMETRHRSAASLFLVASTVMTAAIVAIVGVQLLAPLGGVGSPSGTSSQAESPSDSLGGSGAMCNVLAQLWDAEQTVADAQQADVTGDKSLAQSSAHQAGILVDDAHSKLVSITDPAIRRSEVWQALLEAQLRLGQAANALLPEYANTYGTTPEELAAGRQRLHEAEIDLQRCGSPDAFLPTHKDLNAYPAALLEATLVRQGDACTPMLSTRPDGGSRSGPPDSRCTATG